MGIEFLVEAQRGRDRQQPLWSDLCDRKLLLKAKDLSALHGQLLPHRLNHCSPLVALDPSLFGASHGFTFATPISMDCCWLVMRVDSCTLTQQLQKASAPAVAMVNLVAGSCLKHHGSQALIAQQRDPACHRAAGITS